MENELYRKISDWILKRDDLSYTPLFVLLGPTASGKTALSLEIAKRFNGEIVSVDSRQVYRHMDIGTDKIPLEKREGIPHHLIDVVDPTQRFTVADFKKLAEKTIDEIHSLGKLPMLVGGTGLYIRSVTQNFSIPPENPVLRKKLLEELQQYGVEHMYQKLKELDPGNAAKIHPKNIPYILRALEIFHITGQPKSDTSKPQKYECLMIGLSWPWEELFERIHRRIDEQIERGLLEETKKLLEMGYSKNLQSMRSLGYSEMIQHIEDNLSLPEAVELLNKNTRNFAKRQMMWFKKDKEVIWVDGSGI